VSRSPRQLIYERVAFEKREIDRPDNQPPPLIERPRQRHAEAYVNAGTDPDLIANVFNSTGEPGDESVGAISFVRTMAIPCKNLSHSIDGGHPRLRAAYVNPNCD